MRPTRVFILYDHPLFARGLEGLLQGVRRLTVLGSAVWRGEEVLPEGAIQADVVILETPHGTSEAGAAITRLLASRPEARVLCLSLEDNQIRVYSAHSLTATERADLVGALGSPTEAGPPQGGGEI